jgi:hypothetical protein
MARMRRGLFAVSCRRVRLTAVMVARHWVPAETERLARSERIAGRATLAAERRRAAAAFRWTVLAHQRTPPERRHG